MKETEAASASLSGFYSDVTLRGGVHSWKQKQNFTVVLRHLKMKDFVDVRNHVFTGFKFPKSFAYHYIRAVATKFLCTTEKSHMKPLTPNFLRWFR